MGRGDWAERWNADRLVTGVEDVLRRWTEEPHRAAGRLRTLFTAADPRAIGRLETVYRRRRRTVVGVLDAGEPLDAAVAALFTIDRNGYRREAGVRRLTGCADPFVLPFLLLRLNDPVEAVRARAIVAVGARTGSGAGDPAALVRLIPLLRGLQGRLRAAPVVRSVHRSLIDGDAGRTALWNGVHGDDPAVRAGCLRLLATVEPAPAVREALRSTDPVLRHWAADIATAPGFDPSARRDLLPLLEGDHDPGIRRRASRVRALDRPAPDVG